MLAVVFWFLASCSTISRQHVTVHNRHAAHHEDEFFPSSSLPPPSSFSSPLDAIVLHPLATSGGIRRRSRLKPEHSYLFQEEDDDDDDDDGVLSGDKYDDTTDRTLVELLNQLGLVACTAGVLSKKEFLETFAAAFSIHSKFPPIRRMADLAAGHGLLAWFLLAMDDYYTQSNNDDAREYDTKSNNANDRPLTVVCIDRRMPPAAEVIEAAMLERFPHWKDRWSYVQADLATTQPHPSCLMTSVHGCGVLTDTIIDMSIANGGVPLAIVPCCHSVKEGYYRPHPRFSGVSTHEVVALVEERKTQQPNAKHDAVADVVDEVRCETLRNAGFDVEEVLLPEDFTGRNRLILASSQLATTDKNFEALMTPAASSDESDLTSRKVARGRMPPRTTRVPLADEDKSIAICRSLSEASRCDKVPEQITSSKYNSLTLHMAILLGDEDGDVNRVAERLQTCANDCCEEMTAERGIQCTVAPFGEVQSPTERPPSQLYTFTYTKVDGTKLRRESRAFAKRVHGILRDRVVEQLGYSLR